MVPARTLCGLIPVKSPPARLPDEAGVTSLASDRPLEAWAGSASSLHPHDGTNTTHRTRQEQRASRPTGPLRLGRGALVRYSCMGPLWSHIGPRNGPNNLGAPPGHTAQHSTAQHSTPQRSTAHGTARHTAPQRWCQIGGHFGPPFVIKEGRRTAHHRAAHHHRHDDTDDDTDDAQGAA